MKLEPQARLSSLQDAWRGSRPATVLQADLPNVAIAGGPALSAGAYTGFPGATPAGMKAARAARRTRTEGRVLDALTSSRNLCIPGPVWCKAAIWSSRSGGRGDGGSESGPEGGKSDSERIRSPHVRDVGHTVSVYNDNYNIYQAYLHFPSV